MKILAILIVVIVLGLMAYVRFMPVDPVRWHPDIAAADFVPAGNAATFCAASDARVTLDPGQLAALDRIALATPRTTRLAGSAAEGRVSWVTRSALWGFPDVTTAAVRDVAGTSRLCLVARQVYGLEDMGVNAARLTAWVQELTGLNEAPDLGWPPTP